MSFRSEKHKHNKKALYSDHNILVYTEQLCPAGNILQYLLV